MMESSSASTAASDVAPRPRIRVVLRMDDYSSVSYRGSEERVFDLLASRRLQVTVAVIPYTGAGDIGNPFPNAQLPLVKDKAHLLREAISARVCDPALHGYTHQSLGGRNTEFVGLPLALQYKKIQRGQQCLEDLSGVSVQTFVPPWNSYDRHTLQAVEDLGFKCISAHRRGPWHRACRIKWVPMTCSLKELSKAVSYAKSLGAEGTLVVAGFHDYDFLEVEERRGALTFREFIDTIDAIRSDPEMQLMSIGQLLGEGVDLGVERYRQRPVLKELLIPPICDPWGLKLVYVETRLAQKFRQRLTVRLGVFYGMCIALGALFVLGGAAVGLAFPKALAAAAALLAGALIVSVIRRGISYKMTSVLMVLGGGVLGALLSWIVS
jgi:peptidoglycan/xylan/chitin deacetylase (PgdA/CDA1 family)